jgi:hypothetical protein
MKIFGLVIAIIWLCSSAYATEPTPEQLEYYKGAVDGQFDFVMVLKRNKDDCSGYYYYTKHKKDILLRGICESGKYELKEVHADGFHSKVKTNGFAGAKKDARIEGYWHSADGKKSYRLEAVQFYPTKKKILGEAKGEYRLNSISGAYGANTLSEVYRDKGAWVASWSSNHGGRRESNSTPRLSKTDKYILSSMKVAVDQDLAVALFANGKVIYKFPYKEKSVFDITQFSKEDGTYGPYRYLGIEDFYDDALHIAVTDKIDASDYIRFENTPMSSIYAISLDYSIMKRVFEISVIDKQCCNVTHLIFKKR